ncbi:MAG: hypothetical protein LIO79_07595 [Rikenellaceae bacterium]|nr:hypothetical protein [Rikenellaceae bacterium]
MGFVSRDIAVITEPNIVSLSALPNFVQFASKPAVKQPAKVNIGINIVNNEILPYTSHLDENTQLLADNDSKGVGAGLFSIRYATDPDNFVEKVGDYFKVTLKRLTTDASPAIWARNKINTDYRGVNLTLDFWARSETNGLPLSINTDGNNYTQNLTTSWTKYSIPVVFGNGYGDMRLMFYITASYSGNANSFYIRDVSLYNSAINIPYLTLLRIIDSAGSTHVFRGTSIISDVGGSTFYVADDTADTAENLRSTLLRDKWVSANFEVTIPFTWEGDKSINGAVLTLESKGAGIDYNISLEAPNNANNAAYSIEWINQTSTNNDSISGEASTAEIELDIYTDPDIFLGQDDRPISTDKLGRFATTLQKTYAGVPVWFELNALFSQYNAYNRPVISAGWFNPGTMRAYRFVAKVTGFNSYPFYQSNALYVLNGYGPLSEGLEMDDYVYRDNIIKLLTDKPRTPYIRGQREYLNFIFSDPQRGLPVTTDFTLRIAYRVYSSSDKYIATVYAHEKKRADFSIVNTCILNIDAVLDRYPDAGIIRVALARGIALVSNDLEYIIRPECLHTLRQFSFINRLGGWDAFNFDAGIKDEIKPSVETYNKTLTPSYQKGDSIETVYNTTLANTFTIEGAPVTDDVAAWLKELAAARVILDNDGNYIIIEDFTLQVTGANKNMQKPTIKYRLSE